MMIRQRLGGGLSMEAVVKDALLHGRDFFPDNKRVREATLSPRDTAFSDARQRLKPETVTHLLEAVSGSLIDASKAERPVFIVDGTTLTTAPTDDLKNAFPPAVNEHGESVWPTVLMLVAHELHSGCALVPEIGAMYGDDNTSESRLLKTLCTRFPAVELYRGRDDVEHDLRDVKVTLNTERIRAHSSRMFRKELLMSLVAYNLVIQFRREAAAKAGVRPRQLSFTGVWNTFQSFFLKPSPASTVAEWESRYDRALTMASRELLRHRPGRSYPRRAHPRRPKTTPSQNNKVHKNSPQKTRQAHNPMTTLGPWGAGPVRIAHMQPNSLGVLVSRLTPAARRLSILPWIGVMW